MVRLFLTGTLLVLFYSQPVFMQTTDSSEALRKEIEALKEGQAKIVKELAAIKKLLTAAKGPPPFKPVVVNIGDDPFKGDVNAKVAVLDFTDFQ